MSLVLFALFSSKICIRIVMYTYWQYIIYIAQKVDPYRETETDNKLEIVPLLVILLNVKFLNAAYFMSYCK